MNNPVFKINVRPFQAQQLPAPHTGNQKHGEDNAVFYRLILDNFHEADSLFIIHVFNCYSVNLRRVDAAAGLSWITCHFTARSAPRR